MLPAAQDRGDLHFYVARSLPYGVRIVAALIAIAAGLAGQIAYLDRMEFWFGVAAAAAGVVLLLCKGYRNTVALGKSDATWRTTTRAEIDRILELNWKTKRWDQTFFDITNLRGFVLFAAAALATLIACGQLESFAPNLARLVLANAAIVLVFFWFTGVRFVLTNDGVVVRAKLLREMEDLFLKLPPRTGETFEYQIQTMPSKEGAGSVPKDLKALVLFREGPADFLGMQMQVSLNNVQGKDYPYFYAVLVARTAFGALDGTRFSEPPDGIVLEFEPGDGVTVAIIRQLTTKTSGYHTPTAACAAIFTYAMRQARNLVQEQDEHKTTERKRK